MKKIESKAVIESKTEIVWVIIHHKRGIVVEAQHEFDAKSQYINKCLMHEGLHLQAQSKDKAYYGSKKYINDKGVKIIWERVVGRGEAVVIETRKMTTYEAI